MQDLGLQSHLTTNNWGQITEMIQTLKDGSKEGYEKVGLRAQIEYKKNPEGKLVPHLKGPVDFVELEPKSGLLPGINDVKVVNPSKDPVKVKSIQNKIDDRIKERLAAVAAAPRSDKKEAENKDFDPKAFLKDALGEVVERLTPLGQELSADVASLADKAHKAYGLAESHAKELLGTLSGIEERTEEQLKKALEKKLDDWYERFWGDSPGESSKKVNPQPQPKKEK